MDSAALPFEIAVLGWSVVLLAVHIVLQGMLATRELGAAYNVSPRDEERQPKNPLAGRAARALRNFLETYPAFVALALALAVTGRTGGLGATGAAIWFSARLVFLPIYLVGIPYLRSLVWVGSMAGLVLMLIALLA